MIGEERQPALSADHFCTCDRFRRAPNPRLGQCATVELKSDLAMVLPTSHSLDVPGAPLYYEVCASGPVLMLIGHP